MRGPFFHPTRLVSIDQPGALMRAREKPLVGSAQGTLGERQRAMDLGTHQSETGRASTSFLQQTGLSSIGRIISSRMDKSATRYVDPKPPIGQPA
jgi:hypothetical protein